jgi:hypothetical protein
MVMDSCRITDKQKPVKVNDIADVAPFFSKLILFVVCCVSTIPICSVAVHRLQQFCSSKAEFEFESGLHVGYWDVQ